MPNHVHALFTINPTALSVTLLPDDTADLQIGPTEMRNPSTVHKGDSDVRSWPYRFHDQIVRTDQNFDTIPAYILTNLERWQ